MQFSPPPITLGNGNRNGNGNGNGPRKVAHDDIAEIMQIFEQPFDDHLDRFCSLNDAHTDADERIQFAALLDVHSDELERALWWSLSRLVFSRFAPRAVFPGRLCKQLISHAIRRPSSATMAKLFDEVRKSDHQQWDAMVESLTQLAAQTRRWTTWPEPTACERATALLDALERPWTAAVEQLRASSRAPQRDDAFLRAEGWRDSTTKILRTLTSPRGGLRLMHEYLGSVREQFHGSRPDRDIGIYELFVLEVVGFVNQLWDADVNDDPRPPKPVEQGRACRRKRIDRARFHVLRQWEPDLNRAWETHELPTLLVFAEHG